MMSVGVRECHAIPDHVRDAMQLRRGFVRNVRVGTDGEPPGPELLFERVGNAREHEHARQSHEPAAVVGPGVYGRVGDPSWPQPPSGKGTALERGERYGDLV